MLGLTQKITAPIHMQQMHESSTIQQMYRKLQESKCYEQPAILQKCTFLCMIIQCSMQWNRVALQTFCRSYMVKLYFSNGWNQCAEASWENNYINWMKIPRSFWIPNAATCKAGKMVLINCWLSGYKKLVTTVTILAHFPKLKHIQWPKWLST